MFSSTRRPSSDRKWPTCTLTRPPSLLSKCSSISLLQETFPSKLGRSDHRLPTPSRSALCGQEKQLQSLRLEFLPSFCSKNSNGHTHNTSSHTVLKAPPHHLSSAGLGASGTFKQSPSLRKKQCVIEMCHLYLSFLVNCSFTAAAAATRAPASHL